MKYLKKFLVLLFIIGLTGCTSGREAKVVNENKEEYLSYVKKLNDVKKSTNIEYPFDIDVKYDKLTKDEVRFQVIIDNPKDTIDEISAVAIHNLPTDDIFPSTGIFENKQTLVPNKKPSGIILVGYIPYTKKLSSFSCEVKVLIKYIYQNKKYTVYYVTKK